MIQTVSQTQSWMILKARSAGFRYVKICDNLAQISQSLFEWWISLESGVKCKTFPQRDIQRDIQNHFSLFFFRMFLVKRDVDKTFFSLIMQALHNWALLLTSYSSSTTAHIAVGHANIWSKKKKKRHKWYAPTKGDQRKKEKKKEKKEKEKKLK